MYVKCEYWNVCWLATGRSRRTLPPMCYSEVLYHDCETYGIYKLKEEAMNEKDECKCVAKKVKSKEKYFIVFYDDTETYDTLEETEDRVGGLLNDEDLADDDIVVIKGIALEITNKKVTVTLKEG